MANLAALNDKIPKFNGNLANNQINKRNEPVNFGKTPLGRQINFQNINRFKRELENSNDFETINNSQEDFVNSNTKSTSTSVLLLNNSKTKSDLSLNKVENTSTKIFNQENSSSSDGLLTILAKQLKNSKNDDKLSNEKFIKDSTVAGNNDSDKTIYETFNELLGINQSYSNEMKI